MKLCLAVLCISSAVLLSRAQPNGRSEEGRGPIRSLFSQLIQTVQDQESEPLVQRLRDFLEKVDRDPSEISAELLTILGDLKEELDQRRAALEEAVAADGAEDDTDPPKEESGKENTENELEAVKEIERRVDRAISRLEGLGPQLVGKLLSNIRPSIEKLLHESEMIQDDDNEEAEDDNEEVDDVDEEVDDVDEEVDDVDEEVDDVDEEVDDVDEEEENTDGSGGEVEVDTEGEEQNVDITDEEQPNTESVEKVK